MSALLVQVLAIVGLGLLLGTALFHPLTVFGFTVVTHDERMAQYCDRVVHILDGTISA